MYLGHRNIQNTVIYTQLSAEPSRNFGWTRRHGLPGFGNRGTTSHGLVAIGTLPRPCLRELFAGNFQRVDQTFLLSILRKEYGVLEEGALEVGARELGILEAGALEVGAPELGVREDGAP